MDRNKAIQQAQIVRDGNLIYEVEGLKVTGPTPYPSISQAKLFVRESKLRCVAVREGEKPSALSRVKTHLGQLKKKAEAEAAAKVAKEAADKATPQ